MLVLLWLLHQKGLFDPLYDWWEDILGADEQIIMDKRKFKIDKGHHHIHENKHHKQEHWHSNYSAQNRRRTTYEHMHKRSERNFDYFDDLHHVHKEMHKYEHKKQNMDNVQHIVDHPAHHKHRKKGDSSKGVRIGVEGLEARRPGEVALVAEELVVVVGLQGAGEVFLVHLRPREAVLGVVECRREKHALTLN